MKKNRMILLILGTALAIMACDVASLLSSVVPSSPTATRVAVATVAPATLPGSPATNTLSAAQPTVTVSPNATITSTAPAGKNLIINGDAEAGPGATDDSKTFPMPGWTVSGKATAIQYGANGGFPAKDSPGPKDRGKNFFVGGPENAQSSAKQTINVADQSSAIDAGNATYQLDGWLGGYASQGDNATVTAEFMDAANKSLGKATLGPVTSKDRVDQNGLFLKSTTGTVPKGTRTIVVTMLFIRVEGSYNDGSVDNLSLVITTK